MKRPLAILFGLASAALHAAPPPSIPPIRSTPSTPPPAILRWNNGETLPGEILQASASDVTWKTPLFEDPLQLRWSALRRVDRRLAAVPAADPFSFELRDGSHIYGSLTSVAAASVSIHSSRHGDVLIRKSELLSARRLHGGSLVFAGPQGDVGWDAEPAGNRNPNARRPQQPPPEIPPLVTGAGGVLSMPYWNSRAYLKLAMPELVDVEFRLHSSLRPDFALKLGSLNVEMWDDVLVLEAAAQFKQIRKVAADERGIALRICWNAKTGKCLVFTPAGELLTEWETSREAARQAPHPSSGLTLQNKGRDLSLDFLRVREWDGTPPPKIDETRPRIELDDGRVLEGEVSGGSADSIQWSAPGEDAEESIPLSGVDAVIFSTDAPRMSEHEATLSYADGTLLTGKFSAVKDGVAALLTSFTETPLASRMDGLRHLRLRIPPPAGAGPEPSFAALDKLSINHATLHGKLTATGDNWPRWVPVGGLTPSRPAKAFDSEIRRALPPGAKVADAPALFYTRAGDVLPGTLRAIDRSGVELESSLVGITKLSADSLDAVQLHPVASPSLNGFSDPGWQVLKGNAETVRRKNGALEMDPGTAIGHPELMQCSTIGFSMVSTGFSSFRVRLFCDGLDGAKSKNLLFLRSGGQFYFGMESSDGQFGTETQMRVAVGAPVPLRLVIDDQSVAVRVDGVTMQRFPIEPSARAGAGLVIEPASAWGNEVNPFSLSGFTAVSEPGKTWLPSIGEETKKQALTVPRFRRDDPPRHALLAPNGDVLRGEVEASTASHFGFRAGLENLKVPTDRVKAVIWLRKPVADAAPSSAASPVLKMLEEKVSRFMSFDEATLETQVKFLERESSGLKFKLPQKRDPRMFPMEFGGKTIGEALGQICASFGLRYRIDADGAIVLEAAPRVQEDLARKVYWLKPDAFPGAGSAQEILAAKGISFPAGAGAIWEPGSGQLEMTNSPPNLEKLAKLLETDFGGSRGSPTHWLLLANGARLGLVVDSFGKDFVTGRHPIYGRCKAPMSEICAIRTSMPPPAPAAASLKDWRLVFAPEPVLPGAGGDSSLLLGKMAKPFKLPLLAGGDFDLSQTKGKIVVLDFWATWCGPCIESLPGLMEAMSAFPADQVRLIGVNQGEPADEVKRFLETRGWKLTVALDADMAVARQFGVEGIPHTVIIGPDGKVAWVKTGYSPGGETEAADAVKKLLAAPSAPVKSATQ